MIGRALLGSISTGLQKSFDAPFERIKLILQNQDAHPNIVSGEIPKFKGFNDCLIRIFREEGFTAFWRGYLSGTIKQFPTIFLNLSLSGTYKKIFCPFDPSTEPKKHFIGKIVYIVCLGATTLIFTYPFDLARTKLALDFGKGELRQYKGIIDCLSKILVEDGVYALYSGFFIHVFSIALFQTLQSSMIHFLVESQANLEKQNKLRTFTISYIIGAVNILVTYPLDTVRRRLMMQSGEKKIYDGVIDCFKKIYQQEGIKGFFKGKSNIYMIVGGAIAYILFQKYLGQKEIENQNEKEKEKEN